VKINSIKALSVSDFQADQQKWLPTLLDPLNQFMTQTVQALNNQITVVDNLQMMFVSVPNVVHSVQKSFQCPFKFKPAAVIQLFGAKYSVAGGAPWTYAAPTVGGANGQIVTTVNFKAPSSSLRVSASGAQSIPTSANTEVTFATVNEATGSMISYDGSGAATLAVGGRYFVWFRVAYAGISGTGYSAESFVSDSNTYRYAEIGTGLPTAGGAYQTQSGACEITTVGGAKTITVETYQNTGAAVSLLTGGSQSRFEISLLEYTPSAVTDTVTFLVIGA
jgi:hypothetical protein